MSAAHSHAAGLAAARAMMAVGGPGPRAAVSFALVAFGVYAVWALLRPRGQRADGSFAWEDAAANSEPVGRYFTLGEFISSPAARELGVSNAPTPAARANLEALVANVLDPLRAALAQSIRITSGYRSPEVNEEVGGSKTSQHMTGEASDIKVAGYGAEELATYIAFSGLPYDQIIWYDEDRGGHVHVSFSTRRNRRQTLWAPAGESGYESWTPDRELLA